MSSLVDELDDEDIEASLLWTDDEDGDHDTIDPLDEELLLSEPTIREEGSPQKEIFSKSTKKSVISQNIEKNFTHEGSLRLNDSSYHDCANNDALETTLTDELVDLDITINTRDSLETSIVENNAKCLNETVCQELFNEPIESVEKVDECTIEIKSNTVNINGECNPVLIPTDMTEDKPADNSSSSTKPETIDNEKDVIKNSNTDEDGKTLQIKLSVNKEHVRPNNNIDSTSEDMCELENKVRKEDIQDVLKEDTNKLISTDSEKKCDVNEEEENLTVIDSIESSLVADKSVIQTSENKNLQEVSENITNDSNDIHCTTPTIKQNSSQSEGDATVKRSSPIDAAIKNIRQAVSKTKRTQSLPNGEEPAQKRFRHSSEPVTVGSTTSNDNTKSVENEKSTTTNILSSETLKPDNKKCMVGKKKSIVTFDYHHYCKEASTDPFVCKTCSSKFKDELKFESHLVAHHAMALSISHFNIDLHQYYRQKKEKAIANSKGVLPRLEGVVDKALIAEYNQNVRLLTAQKNIQFFCKKCENIYSTKNLIIEHLKSPKHLLLRKV